MWVTKLALRKDHAKLRDFNMTTFIFISTHLFLQVTKVTNQAGFTALDYGGAHTYIHTYTHLCPGRSVIILKPLHLSVKQLEF